MVIVMAFDLGAWTVSNPAGRTGTTKRRTLHVPVRLALHLEQAEVDGVGETRVYSRRAAGFARLEAADRCWSPARRGLRSVQAPGIGARPLSLNDVIHQHHQTDGAGGLAARWTARPTGQLCLPGYPG